MGAIPVIGDVYDVERLTELVAGAEPDIVVHQLTAFGSTDADPLEETIRVRTEGTRNLVKAARAAGARRFIAQSISFICSPSQAGLTSEETPLYLDAPAAIRPLAEAVAELERQTLHAVGMDGVVLRYGWFYGPGTNYDPAGSIPRSVRKGRAPIVGEGAGTYSFIHVDDAARATMKALIRAKPGIYNVVDDDPARLSEWLPCRCKATPRSDSQPYGRKCGTSVARRHVGLHHERATGRIECEGEARARVGAAHSLVARGIQGHLCGSQPIGRQQGAAPDATQRRAS